MLAAIRGAHASPAHDRHAERQHAQVRRRLAPTGPADPAAGDGTDR